MVGRLKRGAMTNHVCEYLVATIGRLLSSPLVGSEASVEVAVLEFDKAPGGPHDRVLGNAAFEHPARFCRLAQLGEGESHVVA